MTSTEISERTRGKAFGLFAAGAALHAAARPVAPSQRIAILIHDLRGGGAERVALNLAKGMIDAGRQVDLVLVRAQGEYMDQIPAGVRLIDLDQPNVFRAVPSLVGYLRRERPKALLSSLTHVNVVALVAKTLAGGPTRVAVTEHSQISDKAAALKRPRSRLLYGSVPFIYRLADAVIAVSQGTADDVSRFARLRRSPVRCIYNPVYSDGLATAAQAPVDHPWMQPGGIPVILGAGRLHPQKGFDLLMRAFAKVRETTPCKLIIMGEGAERPRLEALARELSITDDVSLTGFVGNPYAMMSRASVFAMSSRSEGFSLVLLEALACGVPVVATDCPSGPSEILEKGRHGLLVPIDDPETLAAGILAALSHKRGAGIERAKSFSTQVATRAYLDLLGA